MVVYCVANACNPSKDAAVTSSFNSAEQYRTGLATVPIVVDNRKKSAEMSTPNLKPILSNSLLYGVIPCSTWINIPKEAQGSALPYRGHLIYHRSYIL